MGEWEKVEDFKWPRVLPYKFSVKMTGKERKTGLGKERDNWNSSPKHHVPPSNV